MDEDTQNAENTENLNNNTENSEKKVVNTQTQTTTTENTEKQPVCTPTTQYTAPEQTTQPPAPEPTQPSTQPPAPEPTQPSTQPVVPEPKVAQPAKATRTEKEKEIVNDLVGNGDQEILKFLDESKEKIVVVGAGGSGGNTLNRLFDMGIKETTLVAMNTDARHLLKIKANKKIIIGKQLTKGKGAGSNPKIGEDAAKEDLKYIEESLKDASMVFVTCGMGGGTGTGSASVIAETARKMGALTIAVVTLPFMSEGKIRMENAVEGLEKLKKKADTVIVIKNDKLLTLAPDLPLDTAFKVCDEVLAGAVKGITELVTKAGLMNVDFADLKTILSDAGYAVIGLGEASLDAKTEDRARVAVETALNSPLLDADISGSTKALINVVGGQDITLKESEYVVSETAKKIHNNAHIIWGARLEEDMKKSSVRVLIVLAGVKFYRSKPPEEELDELDIDLIG